MRASPLSNNIFIWMFLLSMFFSVSSMSCKKKSQAFRLGAKTVTSKIVKRFATYAFGVAFLMKVEELVAEEMFSSFKKEPIKEESKLGDVIIYNNYKDRLTVDLTTDGRNWRTIAIMPSDSVHVRPNTQGLIFISSESLDQTFYRLDSNNEYAVKTDNSKKIVEKIQRN
jgi:hypothetical protein